MLEIRLSVTGHNRFGGLVKSVEHAVQRPCHPALKILFEFGSGFLKWI